MRMLVTQLRGTLMHLWTGFNQLAVAACVAGALLFGGLCVAGGYWFRGAVPLLAGLRAGAQQCQDRPDGSRLAKRLG